MTRSATEGRAADVVGPDRVRRARAGGSRARIVRLVASPAACLGPALHASTGPGGDAPRSARPDWLDIRVIHG